MKHSEPVCEGWSEFEGGTSDIIYSATGILDWIECPWCGQPLVRDVRDCKRGDLIVIVGYGLRVFSHFIDDIVYYWRSENDRTWERDATCVGACIPMPPLPEGE